MPLLGRYRQGAERPVERLLHGILECSGIIRWQGVSLAIGPFVHVEPMHVRTGYAPFLEKIYGPAIHAHGADGQDEGQGPACLMAELNFPGDLMAHEGIEIGTVAAC